MRQVSDMTHHTPGTAARALFVALALMGACCWRLLERDSDSTILFRRPSRRGGRVEPLPESSPTTLMPMLECAAIAVRARLFQ